MARVTPAAGRVALAALLMLLGGAGASHGAEARRGPSAGPAPRLSAPPPPALLDGQPVGVYDRSLRMLHLLDDRDLSIAAPRGGRGGSAEGPIVWHCDNFLVCCIDTEAGGCTDFLFACAEAGGKDTSFGGGMAGTCNTGD